MKLYVFFVQIKVFAEKMFLKSKQFFPFEADFKYAQVISNDNMYDKLLQTIYVISFNTLKVMLKYCSQQYWIIIAQKS